ncbi:EAL domain-containing protein, partial [Oleiphilus sp. HI0123]
MYLVYQAKIDAQSKQVIGFEALLRWHSEHLGQVSPAEFIPVAERNGMIIPIGEFVIQQSLAALVELKAHYN